MKRKILMVFLAGVITLPMLLILGSPYAADGPGTTSHKLDFHILKGEGEPAEVFGRKPRDKILDEKKNSSGLTLELIGVEIVGFDKDPKWKQEKHCHDDETQAECEAGFADPAIRDEKIRNTAGPHCWVNVGGVLKQIHC